MSLELVPLCTVTIALGVPIRVSSSVLVGEVAGITVEGERLSGSQKGVAAADWLHMAPEGYSVVDVRFTMETHDGAVVYVTYNGRVNFGTGVAYTAPTFQTGDERYAWLNQIQAVAKGTFTSPTSITYEMYEVR